MADNGDHDDLHETDYGDDSLAADETYDGIFIEVLRRYRNIVWLNHLCANYKIHFAIILDTLGDGDTTADISTADDQDQVLYYIVSLLALVLIRTPSQHVLCVF